jgi:energy-coupling factor transporter ATP-binding protein EcfA2
MINLPILKELVVKSYGLFPGLPLKPGISISFKPGLTLVIGANGLGKTTLITILYRVLTGPVDIPILSTSSELGTASLAVKSLSARDRNVFAERVADGAESSIARLTMEIGRHRLVVQRRLSDLSLLHFRVDGKEVEADEEAFQNEISRLVGLWSFGDWILLLRHLIFYFEDRRALVWDPSAQRQMLRFLFLPPATAQKWTKSEREILSLDSRIRNLTATLSREEKELAGIDLHTKTVPEIKKRLEELEQIQATEQSSQEKLEEDILGLESGRQKARLRLLKSEQERENCFREAERLRLEVIAVRFPKASDTARYILAQLLTENACLVCGSLVPVVARRYSERIGRSKCVICNSSLASHSATSQTKAAARQLKKAFEIDSLIRRLPPDAATIHQQRTELAALRSSIARLKETLAAQRDSFSKFVEGVSKDIAKQSEQVKRVFDEYASGFLIELCKLTWSPQKARLGQLGEPIEFPAFELELTGSDFATPVRRDGPEQVSESQREFIDLAFRMSLMSVAGSGSRGTLVIDTPESSLDAVFATRAGGVLAGFARKTQGNRLIITSNLVDGKLIPRLAKIASSRGIVDLFALSRSTAATRQLAGEYKKARQKLLGVRK